MNLTGSAEGAEIEYMVDFLTVLKAMLQRRLRTDDQSSSESGSASEQLNGQKLTLPQIEHFLSHAINIIKR